jgi:hypothetical protein
MRKAKIDKGGGQQTLQSLWGKKRARQDNDHSEVQSPPATAAPDKDNDVLLSAPGELLVMLMYYDSEGNC